MADQTKAVAYMKFQLAEIKSRMQQAETSLMMLRLVAPEDSEEAEKIRSEIEIERQRVARLENLLENIKQMVELDRRLIAGTV